MKNERHALKLILPPGGIMQLLLGKSNLVQNLINVRDFPCVRFVYDWILFLFRI